MASRKKHQTTKEICSLAKLLDVTIESLQYHFIARYVSTISACVSAGR